MPTEWKQYKVTQILKACQALHSFKARGPGQRDCVHTAATRRLRFSCRTAITSAPGPLQRCLGPTELQTGPANYLGIILTFTSILI